MFKTEISAAGSYESTTDLWFSLQFDSVALRVPCAGVPEGRSQD